MERLDSLSSPTLTTYHLQYEMKQKNVSRLLATLIASSSLPPPVVEQRHHIKTTPTPPIRLPPPPPPPANIKGPTIFYPTVAPESVVIPIVSSIIGFPILALLVICCLRKRAIMARERDRRRNYDMKDHNAMNNGRFGNRLNGRNSRTLSVCSERSISWAYPSMDLDTVYEERDPEPQRDKY